MLAPFALRPDHVVVFCGDGVSALAPAGSTRRLPEDVNSEGMVVLEVAVLVQVLLPVVEPVGWDGEAHVPRSA